MDDPTTCRASLRTAIERDLGDRPARWAWTRSRSTSRWCPPTIMYEFGAYGLPGRFSHWTHGKAYHRMKTQYDYGLSKIYELVINTNPSYAFLHGEQRAAAEQAGRRARARRTADFFKHNAYFEHTQPLDGRERSASTPTASARTSSSTARDEVEQFLDAVLSIQEHIDPNFQLQRARPRAGSAASGERRRARTLRPLDDLLRPAGADGRGQRTRRGRARAAHRHKFPPEPEKDLLLFLAEHAPTWRTGSATSC